MTEVERNVVDTDTIKQQDVYSSEINAAVRNMAACCEPVWNNEPGDYAELSFQVQFIGVNPKTMWLFQRLKSLSGKTKQNKKKKNYLPLRFLLAVRKECNEDAVS